MSEKRMGMKRSWKMTGLIILAALLVGVLLGVGVDSAIRGREQASEVSPSPSRRLKVVDAKGKPVAGCTVLVDSPKTDSELDTLMLPYTNYQGEIIIDTRPGDYQFNVGCKAIPSYAEINEVHKLYLPEGSQPVVLKLSAVRYVG